MRKSFFYLAVIGWVVGLIVHVFAIANTDITDKVPFVWGLHIGVFVVWLPTILILKKSKAVQELQKTGALNTMNPVVILKAIFQGTPTWLTVVAIGVFFYATISGMIFMVSHTGVADIQDGQYILHDHGQFIKKLTEQEYHYHKANRLRVFSGQWLVFYGFAVAVLFPFGKQKDE